MRRARELGFAGPSAEIAAFFRTAAQACERDGLLTAAHAGYVSAVESAPPGPLLDEARAALAAIRERTLTAEEGAHERAVGEELDERLDAYPRSCPVRRDHSLPQEGR